IAVQKDFVGKKPRTRVALTRIGRKAFDKHVAYLKELLDGGS
ncbi:MAG: Winged helix DNA-binding domain, partial [Pseudomonadota bacterium]